MRSNFEEQYGEVSRQSQGTGQAQNDTGENRRVCFCDSCLEDVPLLRTKGHTDAELGGSLNHRIGNNAKNTDHGQNQSERRKGAEENGAKSWGHQGG